MAALVSEILGLLEAAWPFSWALPEDRLGLQVGDPQKPVEKILVALEVSQAVLDEARSRGAGMLLTHHPLLFRPVGAIREDDAQGRLLAQAVRAGLAVAACHTNLDAAPGGLNDHLAGLLELIDLEPLADEARDPLYKLAVFTPAGYEDQVRQALFAEGAGLIGRYSHCSFAARGQGTFRPGEGARPFRGEVEALSRVEESRLEVLLPESRLAAAVSRMKAAHPYEEVAFDLYPLKNPGQPLALGRVGRFKEPVPFPALVARIKEVFATSRVRLWGQPPERVARAAVLGGSGGEFIARARGKGAQVFITGEVRHHQVVPGFFEDFAVIELGHFVSEAVFMPAWAGRLQELLRGSGLNVEVLVTAGERPPFDYL